MVSSASHPLKELVLMHSSPSCRMTVFSDLQFRKVAPLMSMEVAVT